MNKNLLLYLFANSLSLIGNWIYYVALYWLAFQMTHSPMILGGVSLISCLPILLFSSVGGAISDRFPRKKLLIILQLFSGLLVFILSILCKYFISIEILFIFCFLFGILASLELPVKQTFIPNLIEEKANLSHAISWNAVINHIARIISPLLCSIFLIKAKVYLAFMIDGFLYFVSAFTIYFVELRASKEVNQSKKTFSMIREGFIYIFKKKILFYTILTSAVCTFCLGPYTAQIPSLVNEVYINKKDSLSLFYSFTGLGGLVAAFTMKFVTSDRNKFPKAFFAGFLIAAIALPSFLLGYNLFFGYFALGLTTFGVVLATGSAIIFMQSNIEDKYRGRVMGFYQTLTLGILPLANILLGILSEIFTARNTFFVSSFISLAAVSILFIYNFYIDSFSNNQKWTAFIRE